jgi:nitrogen fixation protein NifU and related proteins
MRYSAAVLERVRDPRCAGSLVGTGKDVGTGEAGSLERGTLIRLQVRIAADRVADAKFKAFGCSAAIASASFVAERVQGMTVAAARSLDAAAVIESLELPPERAHVAGLAVEAARAAIDDVGRG